MVGSYFLGHSAKTNLKKGIFFTSNISIKYYFKVINVPKILLQSSERWPNPEEEFWAISISISYFLLGFRCESAQAQKEIWKGKQASLWYKFLKV